MTEQNIKILNILRKNARISNAEIAERLNMSESDVKNAIEQMEKDGIIIGYAALISTTPAIKEVRAIIEVSVTPERDDGFDRIAANLAKFNEVEAVHLVSGKYDLRLEVVGENLQDVAYFVASKLATQPGVKSTATLFLLKKYKEAGIMLQKDEHYERLIVSL